MHICKRYLISGRVQGVGYRMYCQEIAKRIGLQGWVRNCADGNVEVLALGDENQLAELETLLWQGPSSSQVKDILITSATPDHLVQAQRFLIVATN